ncbi:hypothetical protein HRbin17_00121 [bacterium HR17]|uniref:DUF4340 domain-containing protein n=1 Tax=Candidatus Fervidibacter japonicus TaxID=2035412 RepID=A0A2H5X8V9_9BACT|nr:hypothetical protein HRbin17_00121 [bacterium HR17]
MRLKGAALWAIAFAVLLAYVLLRERGEVVQGTVVLNLNPEDIVKIRVQRQQLPKEVVLERKGKGWWLTKPVRAPADTTTVETLLNRFKNLKAELELEAKKPEYGLANPPVVLTVYDRRGRQYRIEFGNKTPDNMGAYAIVEGWRKPVVLTSWLLDDANKTPDDLRDKRLLVFDRSKVTKIALVYPDKQIVCERKGKDEWRLSEPIRTPADTTAVTTLLDKLSNLQARQFIVERPKETQLVSYQLDKPGLQVQVWLKGRTQPLTVTVGKKHETQPSRYYARTTRFPAVVLVDDLDLKDIRKTANDLRSKRVLAFKKDAVERVTLRYDGTEIDVRKLKAGDDEIRWHLFSPIKVPADTWRVDDILWALDGAQAEGFFDNPQNLAQFGLDRPQLALRLWEKGRKQPKTVWLSVKGNAGYLRTSEGDTVYKVRAGLLNDLKKSPDDLRDLQVVKFKRDDAEEIALRWDKKRVRLVKRGERNWELVEPKRQSANWSTVDSILFELESLRADKWVAEKPAPEHGLDKPQLEAEVKLKGGRTITVKFGKPTDQDSVFVCSSYSENQVYRKAKFVLDNLKRYGDELLR